MAHEEHGESHESNEEHKEETPEPESHKPESEKKAGLKKSMSDSFFDKLMDYVTGKIATFVAFLFFLIALGAIYAIVITRAPLNAVSTVLIIAPAIVGLIAYSNRDLAVVLFFLFLIVFFFIFP